MSNGLSLKSLAEDLLNVSLDKSLELRCSDWEADRLTLKQVIHYINAHFTLFINLQLLQSLLGIVVFTWQITKEEKKHTFSESKMKRRRIS